MKKTSYFVVVIGLFAVLAASCTADVSPTVSDDSVASEEGAEPSQAQPS